MGVKKILELKKRGGLEGMSDDRSRDGWMMDRRGDG
jgi:hypothetical protein